MSGIRYERADEAIAKQVRAVMREHHKHLADAEVAIDVLAAYAPKDANGSPKRPALKARGFQVLAKIRITAPTERACGRADAELVLDGDQYPEESPEQQAALIDHELTHLHLVPGEAGLSVKRDELGRPKLAMRAHDREYGWFDECVRRHGAAAGEARQLAAFMDSRTGAYTQLWLPGMEAAEQRVAKKNRKAG